MTKQIFNKKFFGLLLSIIFASSMVPFSTLFVQAEAGGYGKYITIEFQEFPGLENSKCNVTATKISSGQVFTFSAEDIARKILGRPIMNTALLGAFSAITKELSLEAVIKAVRKKFHGDLGERNARVVRESYDALAGAKR